MEKAFTDTSVDITFKAGWAKFLFFQQFQSKSNHSGQGISHTPGAVTGFDNVCFFMVHFDTGIFPIKGCNCRDSKHFSCSCTYITAGNAIASGIETRTGNKHIGLESLYHFNTLSLGFFHILTVITVTADNRTYDFGLSLKQVLKLKAGTHYPVPG